MGKGALAPCPPLNVGDIWWARRKRLCPPYKSIIHPNTGRPCRRRAMSHSGSPGMQVRQTSGLIA